MVRIFDAENPSERSTPISRVRCSIPSLKNNPVSRRAETIRKKFVDAGATVEVK